MNKNTKAKKTGMSRRAAASGFSAVICIVALAAVIVLNVVIGSLPETLTKYDVSSQRLYEISEQTEAILSGLKTDVTIYHIVTPGSEDATIAGLINRYTAMSDRVTLKKIDPVKNPYFASQYTDTALNENSLIVVSGERSKAVDYYDIYQQSYAADYAYTYDPNSVTTDFCGESEITSAIDFVTNDNLPKLYVLTGHGEQVMSETLSAAITRDNMQLVDLNLLTAEAVPEDAGCVVIIAPGVDISAIELERLRAYMEGGGDLLLISDYAGGELANLYALMDDYGVAPVDGYVFEADPDHYISGYPYHTLPEVISTAITDPLLESGYNVLLTLPQGIEQTRQIDGVYVTTLLQSSEAAYTKETTVEALNSGLAESTEKDASSKSGPFNLAVAINSAKGNVVWFTTPYIIDDFNEQVGYAADQDLVINALGFLTDRPESVSIRGKSLTTDALPMEATDFYAILAGCAVILVLVLAVGIVVVVRRRRH